MTATPGPDWHLQAWMKAHKKKPAHLVTELGWHKTTAYRVWHGRQPYWRDTLNQVAAWLGIEPYELLMPPAEAMKIRRWREILAEEARAHHAPALDPAESSRTGTTG